MYREHSGFSQPVLRSTHVVTHTIVCFVPFLWIVIYCVTISEFNFILSSVGHLSCCQLFGYLESSHYEHSCVNLLRIHIVIFFLVPGSMCWVQKKVSIYFIKKKKNNFQTLFHNVSFIFVILEYTLKCRCIFNLYFLMTCYWAAFCVLIIQMYLLVKCLFRSFAARFYKLLVLLNCRKFLLCSNINPISDIYICE